MDAAQIRLTNLRTIVGRYTAPGRSKKDAAIALNLSPSFLSQLLGGKKMGDDVARKIEAAYDLPFGAMDQLLEPVASAEKVSEPSPLYSSHLLRIDPETIAAALKLVRLSFRNLGLEIDQEENGVPLAFAYQYLLDRQEQMVTAENVIDFSARLRARLLETGNAERGEGGFGDSGGGDRRHGEGRKAS